MESAPERIADVHIEPEDHAYGPLEGIPELWRRTTTVSTAKA